MIVVPRAESSSTTSSPLTTTASHSGITIYGTNTYTDIFGSSATSTPASSQDSTDNSDSKNNFAKSVLEYVFLAVALFLLICITWRRMLRVRRINQPFFGRGVTPAAAAAGERFSPFPQTRPQFAGPSFGAHSFNPYVHLAHLPASYHPSNNRRTQGVDIGPGGQRQGGVSDYNAETGDKDVLPAYDKFGGPPQYVELDATRFAGTPVAGNPSATNVPAIFSQQSPPASDLQPSAHASSSTPPSPGSSSSPGQARDLTSTAFATDTSTTASATDTSRHHA